MEKIIVKKKRKGFTEEFIPEKIHSAIRKSSERILQVLTDEDCEKVSNLVLQKIGNETEVTVRRLHNMVEVALDEAGFHRVAESYRQYRNYKEDAQKIMEAVDAKTLELSYKEDRSNGKIILLRKRRKEPNYEQNNELEKQSEPDDDYEEER